MENKKPAPSAVPDKFDDPDFNPFETKSKLENKQPAPSVVPDKFDDPNFNPFETKTKVTNTFDEPADDPPVKGNILLDNVMKGICRVDECLD